MATPGASDPSQNLLTSVKRAQVKGACQECRRRKEKVRFDALIKTTWIEVISIDHPTSVMNADLASHAPAAVSLAPTASIRVKISSRPQSANTQSSPTPMVI